MGFSPSALMLHVLGLGGGGGKKEAHVRYVVLTTASLPGPTCASSQSPAIRPRLAQPAPSAFVCFWLFCPLPSPSRFHGQPASPGYPASFSCNTAQLSNCNINSDSVGLAPFARNLSLDQEPVPRQAIAWTPVSANAPPVPGFFSFGPCPKRSLAKRETRLGALGPWNKLSFSFLEWGNQVPFSVDPPPPSPRPLPGAPQR